MTFFHHIGQRLDHFPGTWKTATMQRSLAPLLRADLARKTVFLSGPRQVGKSTLALALAQQAESAQVLNWDVAADPSVIHQQSWSPSARLAQRAQGLLLRHRSGGG